MRLSEDDLLQVAEAAGAGPGARATRARCLLLSHWGRSRETIAAELAVDVVTVALWQGAYAAGGLARVLGIRRRSRKDASERAARVRAAVEALGPDRGRSVRRVARLAGLPSTTTFRILRDLEVRPARRRRRAARAASLAAEEPDEPPPEQAPAARVVVVGVGGAGGRIVHRLRAGGVATLALDTDRVELDAVDADRKLLVGKSLARGLGANGVPELAARCAEAAAAPLADLLAGASLVFVVAALGGGTGTGVAPIVARIARGSGATVVALVAKPFRIDRARFAKAQDGLVALREHAHTTVALDDDRLLRYVPNLPLDQAYRVMDALVAETVGGLAAAIERPALLPLDLAETREVLGAGGSALLLYGEGREPRGLVRDALDHPFLDAERAGATGALLHLEGGPSLPLTAAEDVVAALSSELPPGARLAWGARVVPHLGARMRLVVLLTGVTARTP